MDGIILNASTANPRMGGGLGGQHGSGATSGTTSFHGINSQTPIKTTPFIRSQRQQVGARSPLPQQQLHYFNVVYHIFVEFYKYTKYISFA